MANTQNIPTTMIAVLLSILTCFLHSQNLLAQQQDGPTYQQFQSINEKRTQLNQGADDEELSTIHSFLAKRNVSMSHALNAVVLGSVAYYWYFKALPQLTQTTARDINSILHTIDELVIKQVDKDLWTLGNQFHAHVNRLESYEKSLDELSTNKPYWRETASKTEKLWQGFTTAKASGKSITNPDRLKVADSFVKLYFALSQRLESLNEIAVKRGATANMSYLDLVLTSFTKADDAFDNIRFLSQGHELNKRIVEHLSSKRIPEARLMQLMSFRSNLNKLGVAIIAAPETFSRAAIYLGGTERAAKIYKLSKSARIPLGVAALLAYGLSQQFERGDYKVEALADILVTPYNNLNVYEQNIVVQHCLDLFGSATDAIELLEEGLNISSIS